MDILKNYSLADLEVLRVRFSALWNEALKDGSRVHSQERQQHYRVLGEEYRQSYQKVNHELSQRTLAVHSELQKGGVGA